MDQVHLIRLYYYGQSKSLSEISRIMGLDWRTVRKYVDQEDFNPPSPKLESEIQFCPKLDPYKPLIDQWLSDDKKAPRKQRHTAKRVFNRLTKEAEGFDCNNIHFHPATFWKKYLQKTIHSLQSFFHSRRLYYLHVLFINVN